MIIDLRGPNGSGKSRVVFDLLKLGNKEIDLVDYPNAKTGKTNYVRGYEVPKLGLIVVGRYATACGGCDGIKTQDLVCEAVRVASTRASHVLFEGVIVSTLFSRYLELSQSLGLPYTWAFLDTPLDVCLARIYERNGGKQINETLVKGKWETIRRVREKAEAAGERYKIIDHERATVAVRRLLK